MKEARRGSAEFSATNGEVTFHAELGAAIGEVFVHADRAES